jgi:hypothetical protein
LIVDGVGYGVDLSLERSDGLIEINDPLKSAAVGGLGAGGLFGYLLLVGIPKTRWRLNRWIAHTTAAIFDAPPNG